MALTQSKVVGLIPAAGHGSRLSPLPMSKELYPVGLASADKGATRPKVVAEYLLERMAAAGIRHVFIILRPGKWDIPAYFGDGSSVGMRIAYLMVHLPFGVPFTLNQALPFVGDSNVAFGFPDILFWPENAYQVVLQRLDQSAADVVLGLFPTAEPAQVGLVDCDGQGRVRGIYEKSDASHLRFMWAIAVWRPTFSRFLQDFVEIERRSLPIGNANGMGGPGSVPEYPIGNVIHAAAKEGLVVEAEIFEQGRYIDIGTPRSLIEALQQELGAARPWQDSP